MHSPLQTVAGTLSLRVQQLDVKCETKTKVGEVVLHLPVCVAAISAGRLRASSQLQSVMWQVLHHKVPSCTKNWDVRRSREFLIQIHYHTVVPQPCASSMPQDNVFVTLVISVQYQARMSSTYTAICHTMSATNSRFPYASCTLACFLRVI